MNTLRRTLRTTPELEPIPFRYEAFEAVGRLRTAFHLDKEDDS